MKLLHLKAAGSPLVDRVDFNTVNSCWYPLYSRILATAVCGSTFSNFFASKRLIREASTKAISRAAKRSDGMAGTGWGIPTDAATLETMASEEEEEVEDSKLRSFKKPIYSNWSDRYKSSLLDEGGAFLSIVFRDSIDRLWFWLLLPLM